MSSVPKGLRAKVGALLSSIVPLYTVTPEGAVSTNSFNIRLYEGALIQLLDVGPSGLTATEFERCAWRALIATIKSRATSCSAFEEHLANEIAGFKRERPLSFRVCSRCHFSVPDDYRLDIALWGAKLSISHAPPKWLSVEQPALSDGRTAFADPEFGAYLTMAVRERTKGGALERAARDIAFLLGLLNFSLGSVIQTEGECPVEFVTSREGFAIGTLDD